jgi:hypothetical protein
VLLLLVVGGSLLTSSSLWAALVPCGCVSTRWEASSPPQAVLERTWSCGKHCQEHPGR